MDFQQWYNQLPTFTRVYMIAVFATTVCITYIQALPVGYYFVLNYDWIFNKLQLWRLVTNFLVIGKFSFNFVFFMFMMYNSISKLEKYGKENRRYAEFVMLLFYLCCFVILISMLMFYVFGIEPNFSLVFELLFALIYVETRRDPETQTMVWFIVVKSIQYI